MSSDEEDQERRQLRRQYHKLIPAKPRCKWLEQKTELESVPNIWRNLHQPPGRSRRGCRRSSHCWCRFVLQVTTSGSNRRPYIMLPSRVAPEVLREDVAGRVGRRRKSRNQRARVGVTVAWLWYQVDIWGNIFSCIYWWKVYKNIYKVKKENCTLVPNNNKEYK